MQLLLFFSVLISQTKWLGGTQKLGKCNCHRVHGLGSGTKGADSLVTSDYRSFLLWGIGDTEHWYAETIPYTANDLNTLHLHILT
jgi:hypothetical protein